jgi:hypothetical protein
MKVALVHAWPRWVAPNASSVLALTRIFPESPLYTSV